MKDRVTFRLGEKKYVDIKVSSCNEKMFFIRNAKYTLRNGQQVEESGQCEMQQEGENYVILSALIQPQIKGGRYALEFTYEIPPEILMYNVVVNVI